VSSCCWLCVLVAAIHTRDAGEMVVRSEPMLLDAVLEAALQHAISRDFAQVDARVLPHLLRHTVLLQQRLLGHVELHV
jgi:hypothetical protein